MHYCHNPTLSSPLTRQQLIDWVSPYFKPGDFAVTFTFKPDPRQYRKHYSPDWDRYSKHINHYCNVLNRTIYGRAATNGKAKLYQAGIFELNSSMGAHAHLIIQKPTYTARVPEKSQHEVLLTCWVNLNCAGILAAQKIEPIYDTYGWTRYMFKGISPANKLCYPDINNWYLPTS